MMRVRLRVSGGVGVFPGLEAPRTIDADALEPEDRESLERLVERARFFDLPRRLPAASGSADYQSCEITIEDGLRQHTVTVPEPVPSPALQDLITRLRQLLRR
jgi:hypothetical protein